jgi:hypothetical protein
LFQNRSHSPQTFRAAEAAAAQGSWSDTPETAREAVWHLVRCRVCGCGTYRTAGTTTTFETVGWLHVHRHLKQLGVDEAPGTAGGTMRLR